MTGKYDDYGNEKKGKDKMKHITIRKEGEKYFVLTKKKKDFIGYIYYYPKWKCWIFEPCFDTIYSHDCLTDIADFIKNIKVKE